MILLRAASAPISCMGGIFHFGTWTSKMDAEPEHVFLEQENHAKPFLNIYRPMKFGTCLVGSSGIFGGAARGVTPPAAPPTLSIKPSCCTRGSSPPTSSSEANNGFPQVPRYHGNNGFPEYHRQNIHTFKDPRHEGTQIVRRDYLRCKGMSTCNDEQTYSYTISMRKMPDSFVLKCN